MIKCGECGGKMKRVHRTFRERFRYLAIYECRECETQGFVPRPFTYRLGPQSRCPRCGTYRLVRLRERDRIDRMHSGFLNLLKRITGGKLMHCRYCRLQFYDRRPVASEAPSPAGQALDPAPK